MELLQAALSQNNFGLRKRFPWTSKSLNDNYIQTRIRRKERRYLFDLLEDIYDEDDWPWIERVENPYLWGRYVLRYEEMRAYSKSHHVEEHIMIHATSSENASEIAEQNFDWRLVQRARFGIGVSFAMDASYAQYRASKNSVYIVAGVLVANSSPGNLNQTIPAGINDTTTGYTEDVCIKYNDNEFYPYYILE